MNICVAAWLSRLLPGSRSFISGVTCRAHRAALLCSRSFAFVIAALAASSLRGGMSFDARHQAHHCVEPMWKSLGINSLLDP